MPRARSPNRDRAFNLWIESQGKKKLQDIAAELGVSPDQVRKWKCADKWDAKTKKVTLPNGKGNVTKRKQGGQPGNKNAKGNHGGAPPGNKNGWRHGAYERIMADLLEPDEAEVFNDEGTGEQVEEELRRTLAALNAKEIRLVKRIAQVKDAAKGNLLLGSVTKTTAEKQSGVFEQNEKGHMVKKKGTGFFDGEREDVTVTSTVSVFDALNKLEAELDRVHGKKIKVLAKLEDIKVQRERLALERKRLEGESEQSKMARAWIAALLGEEVDDGENDDEDG
ncbi:phage terminase small subunit [Intestinimonas butyriciproducens]|uniref:phage terminase small subunit n=1 Tax=Intestinimonas butyriciproducens TaxID=1297617 RepID=UPI0018A04FE9|nr:phage terminase small subunit [Intestinimonas butyriciproducens]